METLGHSTITMTLDTYAHVMATTLRAAAERMENALGKTNLRQIRTRRVPEPWLRSGRQSRAAQQGLSGHLE